METPKTAAKAPTGLAFTIADLVVLHGWAEFHGLRMVIELDHCVEGDEYEEVAALYAEGCALRRWILWRDAGEIVVQPLLGRGQRFATVSEALDVLLPVSDFA
jgi:hypothetical protein